MKSTWPPMRSVIAGVPPFVRHVHRIEAVLAADEVADDVRRRAVAHRCVRQRLGLARLEEIVDRLGASCRDHQHVLRAREHRDGRHVLHEVVRQLGIERLVGAVRPRAADREHVPVRCRCDALAGADGARRAGLVLDHDRLAAPQRADFLRDEARTMSVVPGGKATIKLDGAFGIRACPASEGANSEGCEGEGAKHERQSSEDQVGAVNGARNRQAAQVLGDPRPRHDVGVNLQPRSNRLIAWLDPKRSNAHSPGITTLKLYRVGIDREGAQAARRGAAGHDQRKRCRGS